MRFLKPETVRNIYRGVLKRNPTRSEISNFTLDFARNPDLQKSLNSMIYSKEFQIMVMPDLVRLATEEFTGKKVFFLHVPKTAGTSVRLALTEALGVPSFNLYPMTTHIPPSNFSTMEFWPYWAGHANIAAFPDSHGGFTTFRESRSRVLSQYRQNQFNLMPGANPHIINIDQEVVRKTEASIQHLHDFNIWVQRNPLSILSWYIPNPEIQKNLVMDSTRATHKRKVGTGIDWMKKVDAMSEREVAKVLDESMKRFVASGWLHQPKGIVDALIKISGNPVATLPKENEFKKSEIYRPETINAETLEVLEKARKKDRMVFKIATDLGILTDELKVDEDEIFHKSIQKLGYKLP